MPAHSKRSQALDDRICERLADGIPLRTICRDEKISHVTVATWREQDKDFDKRCKDARDKGFDAIAEGVIDIADATDDYRIDGRKVPRRERDPQRDKLRVWTRLELLKKWDPKRYGDLQKHEHSGKVGIEQLVTESRKTEAED